MVLDKRYCVEYSNGDIACDDGGFWYTDKGIIIKWIILGSIFFIFMAWFLGGYIHAKQRLKKGLPLLGYHRFLISYSERKRHGQVPQNHFTFYAQEHPYYPNQQPYQQRPGGPYTEPPPVYNNNDAPPQYFAPPGASKTHPNQHGQGVEMPQYGVPLGQQQNGVVGSSTQQQPQQQHNDVEQGQIPAQLPPRPPQQAKAALKGFVDRFRR
ncbi:hypothetical protein GQ44DRAFT_227069 [Phaeosphaeriaceae sp. PMI808]|nr:hypothetical protein GQ44DRAFT_227069 [Phaeosphaeriaceae sp. PMI808]